MPVDEEKSMKTSYRTLTAAFGAIVLALLFVPSSTAQCGGIRLPGVTHSSWHFQPGQARLLRAGFVTIDDRYDDNASIVGFWHVKFVSIGSPGIRDKTEVDAGYSQWHSDGTEIMNSGGRAPNTGDFCLGVWKKTGERSYKLNHFAAAWDPTIGPIGPAGPAGELIGPANIREEVTLNPDGNQFTGNFTIDQYDESGNSLAHVQGVITGTRITVDTPEQSIF
jgi:hypothetical protein